MKQDDMDRDVDKPELKDKEKTAAKDKRMTVVSFPKFSLDILFFPHARSPMRMTIE